MDVRSADCRATAQVHSTHFPVDIVRVIAFVRIEVPRRLVTIDPSSQLQVQATRRRTGHETVKPPDR